MLAEVISIGTEMTSGARLDTNSQWLSLQLSSIGIPVHFHTTLADNLDENVDAFRIAANRADLVIITGGLGPTLDDLTREALAQLAGVPLVLHEPSLEVIRDMFARRKRLMPERNSVQAMFPEGSLPLSNERGTAPGIYLEMQRSQRSPARVFALPGVPSEMFAMYHAHVVPRLQGQAAQKVIRMARVNCFGLGESAFEELLGDVTARNRDPEVGITVHDATITLRILAIGTSAAECDAKIAATRATIHERLGHYVFAEEDQRLEDVVLGQLDLNLQSVSVVEMGSPGKLVQWLSKSFTRAPRAIVFPPGPMCGGIVQPWMFGGDRQGPWRSVELSRADAASAIWAARKIREECQTTWGLSLLSQVGIDREEGKIRFPTFVGIASAEQAHAVDASWMDDSELASSRAAKVALNALRLELLKQP